MEMDAGERTEERVLTCESGQTELCVCQQPFPSCHENRTRPCPFRAKLEKSGYYVMQSQP